MKKTKKLISKIQIQPTQKQFELIADKKLEARDLNEHDKIAVFNEGTSDEYRVMKFVAIRYNKETEKYEYSKPIKTYNVKLMEKIIDYARDFVPMEFTFTEEEKTYKGNKYTNRVISSIINDVYTFDSISDEELNDIFGTSEETETEESEEPTEEIQEEPVDLD